MGDFCTVIGKTYVSFGVLNDTVSAAYFEVFTVRTNMVIFKRLQEFPFVSYLNLLNLLGKYKTSHGENYHAVGEEVCYRHAPA